jgi:hypothetical protein
MVTPVHATCMLSGRCLLGMNGITMKHRLSPSRQHNRSAEEPCGADCWLLLPGQLAAKAVAVQGYTAHRMQRGCCLLLTATEQVQHSCLLHAVLTAPVGFVYGADGETQRDPSGAVGPTGICRHKPCMAVCCDPGQLCLICCV